MMRSHRTGQALRRVLTTIALAGGLAAAVPATAPAAVEDALTALRAEQLATDAYVYGIPLLNMDKTFRQQTSTSVSDGRGNGPVNRFNHLRKLADPLDRTVVAPNADTLYSIAWYDLSKGPLVIRTPPADRFHVLPFYTPYQENFANIGSSPSALPDGDYVLTPPGWHGRIPAGLRRIRSPYDRAWSIARIVLFGEGDERNVAALQDRYSITPLSRWGKAPRKAAKRKRRRAAARDTTVDRATIPGLDAGDDPLAFFDALGDQLERFPAPARDEPLLRRIAAVGIGPGRHPSREGLSAGVLRGLRAGVAKGRQAVDDALKQLYLRSFPSHNGWGVTRTGNYDTDYTKRAIIDKIGLGALRSDLAVYPFTQTDATLQALTGAKRYVLHFPPGTAHPPAEAFWSLTMYDIDQFFVPNPIDRYVINDRSDLKYGADGSLTLYVQREQPRDPEQVRNWLPAPGGPFRLMLRLYQVRADALGGVLDGSGWKPAPVLPCLPTGTTATGVACAR